MEKCRSGGGLEGETGGLEGEKRGEGVYFTLSYQIEISSPSQEQTVNHKLKVWGWPAKAQGVFFF